MNIDISFAIGIPTLNRWDLLKPSLNKYLLLDFPDTNIIVLDNGNQPCDIEDEQLQYLPKNKNIGVAASWNNLCRKIYSIGNDYALILNDDIYLGKEHFEICNLLKSSSGRFFMTLKDFSVFILPKSTWQFIGEFDENFQCYYEDSDYLYRMKLKGIRPIRSADLSPAIYRENSTSEKEPLVAKWALASKQYYLKKWGGIPGQEKFLFPFDQKPKK